MNNVTNAFYLPGTSGNIWATFVRRTMTDEETKETFKRIEDSRPVFPCLAEETARTAYEEIKKFEEKSEKATQKHFDYQSDFCIL